MLLETDDNGYLIPAHIWTPWFSLLGSKSGFDSIEECFGDLSPHIFALETGLSSDPPMNWRVPDLDGMTLVSNSDAHSPMKLGREANLFDTSLSYGAIRSALKSKDSDTFLGTIEFFPEEGKYHLDGHRKCRQRLWPDQTLQLNGICPECGKPVTCGVLYRVEELADRPPDYKPSKRKSFFRLIPLVEVLGEIFKVGSGSKRVMEAYRMLLERFGSEFHILRTIEPKILDQSGIPLLAEAIRRIRDNQVRLSPGFDGEFGSIHLFEPHERRALVGQRTLFGTQTPAKQSIPNKKWKKTVTTASQLSNPPAPDSGPLSVSVSEKMDPILGGLNRQQHSAVVHDGGPMLIVAGPGTGKTLTLTRRIAYLLKYQNIPPQNVLAVTFTQKAAHEMAQRLGHLLPVNAKMPKVATFHSFCLDFLRRNHADRNLKIIDDTEKNFLIKKAIDHVRTDSPYKNTRSGRLLQLIETAKQNILEPDQLHKIINEPEKARYATAVYRHYQSFLTTLNLFDFDDLIFSTVRMLEEDPALCEQVQRQFVHILVDEYQDLNQGQYRLVRTLSARGRHLFVIGDPDQSIYGFRGSSAAYFNRFKEDYPDSTMIQLTRNYRSCQTILDASFQVIQAERTTGVSRTRLVSDIDGLKTLGIIETPTDKSEAVAIGKLIEQMVGGTGFHSVDFGNIDDREESEKRSFSDFAILYRTGRQAECFVEMFDQAGIPYQMASRKRIVETSGIREVISLLRLIFGRASYGDLVKIAVQTDKGTRKEKLESWVDWGLMQGIPVRQLLDRLIDKPHEGPNEKHGHKPLRLAENLARIRSRLIDLDVEHQIRFAVDEFKPSLSKAFEENNDALIQVISRARKFEKESGAFLDQITLQSDTDIYDHRAEKVALMTMHAAKGLEFPVVFLAGCEANLNPFIPVDGRKTDLQEERRLFYVGMTRAREKLYLSRTSRRLLYGKMSDCQPSPYLSDIEDQLKSYPAVHSPGTKAEKKKQVQLKLF